MIVTYFMIVGLQSLKKLQWLLRFGRDAPSQGLGVYGDIHSETITWICNTIMSAVEMQVYLLYMTHTHIYIYF